MVVRSLCSIHYGLSRHLPASETGHDRLLPQPSQIMPFLTRRYYNKKLRETVFFRQRKDTFLAFHLRAHTASHVTLMSQLNLLHISPNLSQVVAFLGVFRLKFRTHLNFTMRATCLALLVLLYLTTW